MRMLIRCFFLVILSFTCLSTGAQMSKTDSLAQLIEHHPANDTLKSDWMTTLAKLLAYSDPNRAMTIIDEQLPMAQQLHYQAGILNGYNVKSSLLVIQGNLQQALIVCETFLKTAASFHNATGEITANSLLGIIYSQNGNYSRALEYMLASLRIAEQVRDTSRIVALEQNIGNVYNDMEDYDKAIDYYKRSIANTESMVPATPVPPSLYNNIGSVLIHQKHYTAAVEYLEKGRQISLQTNNKRSLSGALGNLSDGWHHIGNDEKAFAYGTQALDISRALGDKRTIANAMINVGTALNDVSDSTLQARHIDPATRSALAIAMLDSAIQLAATMGDPVTREEAYQDLSEIAEKQHNYPLAIAALRNYDQLHDTLVNNDNEKTIMRKFIQYDYDKKAAEMQLQQQITEGRLKEQELLSNQASQQLKLNQNALALSNKDLDLQRLTAQKEQAELLQEQQEKKNIQALADQRDKINTLEIASQRRLKYGLIAGLLLLAVIGVLIYRQSAARQQANQKLTLINTQLDEANKVKAKFLGIISHDLRGPVANLISLINLRKEAPDLLDQAGMEKKQQTITNTAENLLHVMEDILLWSKGQMVAFRPHLRQLQVEDIFEEMRLLYPGTDHIRILFKDPQHIRLHTDEDYLKTMLRNLTSNAIKAVQGQAGGVVEWQAWNEDHHACLSVTDNGPGIPEAQRQALFNDEADIGTRHGLGLPLVRDFAAAVNCSINVDTAPGKGTTFVLVFSTLV